jgi:hypothetical protein
VVRLASTRAFYKKPFVPSLSRDCLSLYTPSAGQGFDKFSSNGMALR